MIAFLSKSNTAFNLNRNEQRNQGGNSVPTISREQLTVLRNDWIKSDLKHHILKVFGFGFPIFSYLPRSIKVWQILPKTVHFFTNISHLLQNTYMIGFLL